MSPVLSGLLLANPPFFSVPFFLAGGLKIVYDISLYKMFQHVKPPEEHDDEPECPALSVAEELGGTAG